MTDNKIASMVVDQVGFVHSDTGIPIEMIEVNGEMAPVKWFRKGNTEYNGKYVISVEWEKDL